MKSQRRILFVSRAYPPVVGGIENQNYELSQALPRHCDIRTIANPYGKKALPFFLPLILVRLTYLMRDYDTLLLGDGVLAVLGAYIARIMPNKKIVCIIHGLDVTYGSSIYQGLWVQRFLPMIDHFIAVGNYSRDLCIAKGLAPHKITFVPNGVDPVRFVESDTTKEDLWSIIGEQYRNKKVILTSGRLARRKGVAWFVENVLKNLPREMIYVVAGDGPDRDNIHEAVVDHDLEDRVILLGYVSDQERLILFHTCDIFVQANISVHGDVEGFGLTPVEAAVSGIPVLAANLEGLKDAIIDGENGFSLASGDSQVWQSKVLEVLSDDFDRVAFGQKASDYTAAHYSWDHVAQLYTHHL